MLVTAHFSVTPTSIEFRAFPSAMLGTRWEQTEHIGCLKPLPATTTRQAVAMLVLAYRLTSKSKSNVSSPLRSTGPLMVTMPLALR